jgi:hypothetical protein
MSLAEKNVTTATAQLAAANKEFSEWKNLNKQVYTGEAFDYLKEQVVAAQQVLLAAQQALHDQATLQILARQAQVPTTQQPAYPPASAQAQQPQTMLIPVQGT